MPFRYPNVFETLLNIYMMMLGEFDVDGLLASNNFFLGAILFVLFTFMNLVILFNLLIAIMSDTYERVRENEEATFLQTRAETICDMQKASFRRIKYEPWVHALMPQESTGEGGSGAMKAWKGKLGEIKDLIKGLQFEFINQLEKQSAELTLAMSKQDKKKRGRGGAAGKK